MKKVILSILSCLILCGCNVQETLKTPLEPEQKAVLEKKDEVESKTNTKIKEVELLTLFSTESLSPNKAWVGTFQLAWNDMKNNIIKHDIEFINEAPTSEVIGLNKEEFNSSMLNEKSYYTSYGETSFEARDKIARDIKRKFSETSDILHMGDWSRGIGKYYAYAMLKKEFEFYHVFDELEDSKFNNQGNFKYFGINNKSEYVLGKNVKELFYNDENDYAIQLLTKSNDIIYLYRTEENANFQTIYKKMLDKHSKYEGGIGFRKVDTLKIPNIKISLMKNFPELCNKIIKDTKPSLVFSTIIETLQFELDKKGGKVKSEAIIMTENQAISIDREDPRHFDFDKTFVIFLVDSGKNDPYAALRIEDLNEFQK